MKRLLIIPFLLLIGLCDLRADEFRYRTKFQNSDYVIELKDEYWVLSNLKTRTEKYEIKDQGFGTMSILISNDGEKVVVIDDFSVGIEMDNRTIVWLFCNGELVQSYNLYEIIEDKCNLSVSVSHISWCLSDFRLDSDKNRISFSTNEMYYFEIDLSKGELYKHRPIGFTEETIIAYGKVQKLEGKRCRMHIIRALASQGTNSEYIDYTTSNVGFENSVRLIAIDDDIEITPKKYLFEMISLQECID